MRFVFVSLAAALPLIASAGNESLREKPPFSAPAPAQPGASNNALATLELVGIAVIDKEPRFGLRDIGTNRAYWLTLNREQDGLTVVSYDANNHTATVQGRGASRLLVLKAETITPAAASQTATVNYAAQPQPRPAQSAVAASAPQPVPQPEPVPANLTPEQKKQRQAETEARMLVSDLMEISMQERARYAEEQRRRAVGQQGVPQNAPQQPPASAPVNPPTK